MIIEDLKFEKYFQSDIVKSVAIKLQPGFLEPAKLSHERISLSGLIHFLLQTSNHERDCDSRWREMVK